MKSELIERPTDSPTDMIAHMADPKPLVVRAITDVKEKFNLEMPTGSITHQFENIANFIMNQFKTVSPAEIDEAFTLHAAGKLPNDVYIRYFDLHTVGKVLKEFMEWRRLNRPKTAPVDVKVNIRSELNNDYFTLKNNRNFNITRYVDEKWDFLTAKKDDFDSEIDQKKVDEYEEAYKKKKSGTQEAIGDAMTALGGKEPYAIWALNKFKAEKIKEYLLKLMGNEQ